MTSRDYTVRNERVAAVLGMPFSTANNRLKKMIFYSLLVKCQLIDCFVCLQPIASYLELSIEHKEPWENRSIDLFWDLENIGFSHRKCNTRHNTAGGNGKVDMLKGLYRCYKCKYKKPIEEFYKNRNNWNGLNSACKLCAQQIRRKTHHG